MKKDYMRVEGVSGLYRDPHSKAIINMDQTGYDAYIIQKQTNERKRKVQQEVRDEIDSIRNDVNDIKNLLLKLLEKN